MTNETNRFLSPSLYQRAKAKLIGAGKTEIVTAESLLAEEQGRGARNMKRRKLALGLGSILIGIAGAVGGLKHAVSDSYIENERVKQFYELGRQVSGSASVNEFAENPEKYIALANQYREMQEDSSLMNEVSRTTGEGAKAFGLGLGLYALSAIGIANGASRLRSSGRREEDE